MHPSIERRLPELETICRRFHVGRLEVFGSAAGSAFDPSSSDLDFLVDFLPATEGQYFDTYFGLLEALEGLFGRPVDLVVARAIRNRYFLESVNRSRQVLYAA